MKTVRIRKGLDVPIAGEPVQEVPETRMPARVAVLGLDYPGMKPQLEVSVGDAVKLGQLLFRDRKRPLIGYTAPGAGRVVAIHRGSRRALLSVVIQLEGEDEQTFPSYDAHELSRLPREEVVENLLRSGLWTSLRSRPFSSVADPEALPSSLFIQAMDTNPLAPSVPKTLEGKERHFRNGLKVLTRLTSGRVFLCKAPGTEFSCPDLAPLSVAEFSGPHPAGNPGTHIHFLDPAGRDRQAWYICAQDVAAVGALFTTGRLPVERVISLAGPSVRSPRLLRTRMGASLTDITEGEIDNGPTRTISGSVLSGHRAEEATAFLGRYHQQVSVIPEGGEREFLGWMRPGLHRFSVKNLTASRIFPGRRFALSGLLHGEERAIFPIGAYEKVMPLDVLPTFLLKALAVDDVEEAESLGCLELDEEDLALCTFVCPSKVDHGANLRRNLAVIQKEG
jgi:Na+-transporting NADH:ubiquinone oxidoreductase subunit A